MKATLAIVAAAAAVSLAPEAFELDRLRLAEPWRLLTGHLAHYSLWHFVVDAGTLLALGALFEREAGSLRWLALMGAAAAAISGAFLLLEPHRAYRGLSGLDCTAFAAGLVIAARRRPLVAAGLGALLGAKLLWENWTGGFIFPQAGLGDMGAPVMSAHWVGAVVGLLSAGWAGAHRLPEDRLDAERRGGPGRAAPSAGAGADA